MSSIRAAAVQLTTALDSLSIPYALGGSFASSVHGVARATQDLDIVAAIMPLHITAFVAAIEKDFYVDAEIIRDALRYRRSFNVIHFATGFKIDIFPVLANDLGPQQIRRRSSATTTVLGGEPITVPVISAEDTILVKLRWYRDGGESSERQWNDLRNVVKVQGARLDSDYMTESSRALGVLDLLTRLMNEKEKGRPPDDHA